MSHDHSEIWAALVAPLGRQEEDTRPLKGGRSATYITARGVMNRLDMVLGPENWWDEYTVIEDAVVCKLTLRLPGGMIVSKTDAGSPNNDPRDRDETKRVTFGDALKEAFSDALKRTAVKFGVGRYLYNEGVPCYHVPAAEPAGEGRPASAPALAVVPPPAEEERPAASGRDQVPRTGKALWAWASEHDRLDRVQAVGRSFGHPDRIVQWDADQVAAVYREVCVKDRARSRQYQEA